MLSLTYFNVSITQNQDRLLPNILGLSLVILAVEPLVKKIYNEHLKHRGAVQKEGQPLSCLKKM